jgi:hypothetical protein
MASKKYTGTGTKLTACQKKYTGTKLTACLNPYGNGNLLRGTGTTAPVRNDIYRNSSQYY